MKRDARWILGSIQKEWRATEWWKYMWIFLKILNLKISLENNWIQQKQTTKQKTHLIIYCGVYSLSYVEIKLSQQ